ncbi:hypothetical protein OIO90_006025 [Microbotryomycetes sp. JL221]|nr:hypothetical protein OIO90_006025 [Microbotryomycetes sp. JL221]
MAPARRSTRRQSQLASEAASAADTGNSSSAEPADVAASPSSPTTNSATLTSQATTAVGESLTGSSLADAASNPPNRPSAAARATKRAQLTHGKAGRKTKKVKIVDSAEEENDTDAQTQAKSLGGGLAPFKTSTTASTNTTSPAQQQQVAVVPTIPSDMTTDGVAVADQTVSGRPASPSPNNATEQPSGSKSQGGSPQPGQISSALGHVAAAPENSPMRTASPRLREAQPQPSSTQASADPSSSKAAAALGHAGTPKGPATSIATPTAGGAKRPRANVFMNKPGAPGATKKLGAPGASTPKPTSGGQKIDANKTGAIDAASFLRSKAAGNTDPDVLSCFVTQASASSPKVGLSATSKGAANSKKTE